MERMGKRKLVFARTETSGRKRLLAGIKTGSIAGAYVVGDCFA